MLLVSSQIVLSWSKFAAGARRGLLIRGGDALERLANVDTVVMDKTGTLTQGKLVLTGVQAYANHLEPGDILRYAAAVERTTQHPLADAVVRAASEAGGQRNACLSIFAAGHILKC